jgi:hypothetical protein
MFIIAPSLRYYQVMSFSIVPGMPVAEYNDLYGQVRKSNLLQSYEYGIASARVNYQIPRRFKILVNGQTAGVFQTLEAKIFSGALHGIIMDRGPLWLEGYGSDENFLSFLEEYDRMFPRRPGRRRRIIPEWPENIKICSLIKENAYKPLKRPGYSTIWMGLTKTNEELRAGMRQKWRNVLNKSERFGFDIDWDDKGTLWPELRCKYIEDRKKRGYPGPSPVLLDHLVNEFAASKNLLIGKLSLNSNFYSGMLVFRHGRSATWQAGLVSPEGRKTGAGYRLLWESCRELKRRGTDDFDLGGVNETKASGIRHFKKGLGGEEVTLAGHFL